MDSNIINMLTNYNDIYEMYISTNVSIYGYIWRNCSSHKESLTTLKVFWSDNTFGLVVCSNGVSNFPLEKWGETNLFFNATERADVMLLLLAEWYEKNLTFFVFF